jgi:hypothetical protein
MSGQSAAVRLHPGGCHAVTDHGEDLAVGQGAFQLGVGFPDALSVTTITASRIGMRIVRLSCGL